MLHDYKYNAGIAILGLSPTSCARVVTSPTITELEESPSMAQSSKMKTSPLSTPAQEFFLWPTLAQTPMDRNFSCVPPKHLG